MELDMRKMRILQAIIDDYILTGDPRGLADGIKEIRHRPFFRHYTKRDERP